MVNSVNINYFLMTHFSNNWLFYSALLHLLGGGSWHALVNAWEVRANFNDDAHPGNCTVNGFTVAPGETMKYPDDCYEIICSDNGSGDAVLNGCRTVAPPAGCEWGDYIDIVAPFSECCARHVNCSAGLDEEKLEQLENVFDEIEEV